MSWFQMLLVSISVASVDVLAFVFHAGKEYSQGRKDEAGGEVHVGHCGWGERKG